jgi:dTDP-glucose pyrophosphorylase
MVAFIDFKNKKNIFIFENNELADVIKCIDEAALQIAIVLDQNKKVLGLVTDGDIRRGLLRGLSLQSKCSEVVNRKFNFTRKKLTLDQALVYMNANSLSHLPHIGVEGEIVGMYVSSSLANSEKIDSHVVIMAGGRGERLFPLTANTPKPLINYGEKSLIEHVIQQCKISGFKNFIITVNYLKEKIIDFLGDGGEFGVSIKYIEEEFPLGTAGSLSLIKSQLKISEEFLLVNSDVIHNSNLATFLEFHKKSNNIATIGIKPYQVSVPYGVIEIKDQKVQNLIEKPIYTYLVNAGIYAFNQKVIEMIPENTLFNTTDLLDKLIKNRLHVGAYQLYEDWVDVGTRENLLNGK